MRKGEGCKPTSYAPAPYGAGDPLRQEKPRKYKYLIDMKKHYLLPQTRRVPLSFSGMLCVSEIDPGVGENESVGDV